MEKQYVVWVFIGILIVFFAIPLGELYGGVYLQISGGMETERLLVLTHSAVNSFQIIGGIISILSGIAYICKKNDK